MLRRFAFAVTAASAVLMAVTLLGLWLGAVLEGAPASAAARTTAGHLSFFVFLFGLPFCLALTALLGGLSLAAERRRGRPLSGLVRLLIPAATAALVLPLAWGLFWGRPFALGLWLATGAVAGLLGGCAFWRIMGARPDAALVAR